MTLRVNQLAGFNRVADAAPVIELKITTNVFDYGIFTEANDLGGDFLPSDNVVDGEINITISNNITIGSTNVSIPAMSSGTGWGSGWLIYIFVVGDNTARIQAAGGEGGDGLTFNYLIKPDFPLFLTCGAGGGGSGTVGGLGGIGAPGGPLFKAPSGTRDAGGAGFDGTDFPDNTSPGPVTSTAGAAGGTALFADTAGPDIHLQPAALATLEVFGGGGGGGGSNSTVSFSGDKGGDGGGPGLAGGIGEFSVGRGPGKAGGANGLALVEEGVAQIFQDGPGPLDIRGV